MDMVEICKLGLSDAEDYRTLMFHGYEHCPQAFTSTVEDRAALPLSWWEERLGRSSNPSSAVIGARRDGDLCGVVGISYYARQRVRHKAKLFGVYVRESDRGLGIGGKLIDVALDELRRRDGIEIVQLSVTASNEAAQALYRKKGFVEYGREPDAIALDGGYLDKIFMWRRLEL